MRGEGFARRLAGYEDWALRATELLFYGCADTSVGVGEGSERRSRLPHAERWLASIVGPSEEGDDGLAGFFSNPDAHQGTPLKGPGFEARATTLARALYLALLVDGDGFSEADLLVDISPVRADTDEPVMALVPEAVPKGSPNSPGEGGEEPVGAGSPQKTMRVAVVQPVSVDPTNMRNVGYVLASATVEVGALRAVPGGAQEGDGGADDGASGELPEDDPRGLRDLHRRLSSFEDLGTPA